MKKIFLETKMSHSDCHHSLQFNFEGQFLGFVVRAGKLKHLRLMVLSEELQIKIPKVLRDSVSHSLQPGEMIGVMGVSKFNRRTHKLKLKATQVTLLSNSATSSMVPVPISNTPSVSGKTKVKPKVKVLVCQKSGCLKKGGKGLLQQLEQILRDRNLDSHVKVQSTGCLKHCSSAPNVVMIPGNHRYTKVSSKAVPKIVEGVAQKLEIYS
ncbi:MAG TPA: (2Fe-2S) ferredoxin domain-containing protein [Leptolyngbyaceae cyanobacterium M33_DOE_097]|uniref:(2Fe-2S) ferredoxin domain-containing protein n=1 Tax=Oscillatoriales cyanobacterium SpSt-418 TaxID=2282169 RepID=A0A7C3PJ55_9CYAN|nr:(2Fe-2S) ferredoxin domain-containing protein [Leptolyngbyaceae cyanobacterium M33_DOE_097]